MLITLVVGNVHVAERLKFHSVDKRVCHADQRKCGKLPRALGHVERQLSFTNLHTLDVVRGLDLCNRICSHLLSFGRSAQSLLQSHGLNAIFYI